MKAKVKATGEIVTLYGTIVVYGLRQTSINTENQNLNILTMTREKAIDNLSIAFGECRDAIRRQADAIGRMADDMDRLNEAYGKIKALAKSLPRQNRKSYESPYAKFDKLRKKRR